MPDAEVATHDQVKLNTTLAARNVEAGPKLLLVVAAATACLFVASLPFENSLAFPELGPVSRMLGVASFGLTGLVVISVGAFRPPNFLSFSLLGLSIWASLSAVWAPYGEAAIGRSMTFLQLAAMCWMFAQIMTSRGIWTLLLWAYVAGAAVAAVTAVASLRTISAESLLEAGIRISSFGANPNEIGLTLVLAVVFSVYCMLDTKIHLLKVAFLATAILCAFGVILTASRGSFVALCVAGIGCLWMAWSRGGSVRILFPLALVGTLILAPAYVPLGAMRRLATIPDQILTGGLNLRVYLWNIGWDSFVDNPLLGVGAGGYAGLSARTVAWAKSGHNTYLSVLVELGLLGFGVFCVALLGWARTCWTAIAARRSFLLSAMAAVTIGLLGIQWEHRKVLWFAMSVAVANAVLEGGHPAKDAPSRARSG